MDISDLPLNSFPGLWQEEIERQSNWVFSLGGIGNGIGGIPNSVSSAVQLLFLFSSSVMEEQASSC